jgi:hypothetical protein
VSDLLTDWREAVDQAADGWRLLSDERARAPLALGKWSTKEVVGHLVDSAAHNHQRFVRAQWVANLICAPYEQDEWVRTQHYIDAPWPELVELFRTYNHHLARVVATLPDEVLDRRRHRHNMSMVAWQPIAEDMPVTLRWFVADYVAHLQHHVRSSRPR